MPLQLIREIKILKQLQHKNLLQMIEVVTSKGVEHLDPDDPVGVPADESSNKSKSKKQLDNYEEDQAALTREKYKGNLFLVLEYVTHDLTGLMDVAYHFSPVQVKCIMQQLLQALQFMHEHKNVHRDIKSSNILLDSHYNLKLADFGLARSLEPPLLDQMEPNGSGGSVQDLTNKVITLWYRPPEILLGTVHYGCAVDVWSAGCILAELMTGKPLAAGKTEIDQLTLLADLTGTPNEDTWDYLMSLKKSRSLADASPAAATVWRGADQKPCKLRDRYGPNSRHRHNRRIPDTALNLLEKMLEWDPRKRISAANALENRYFWTQPVAPTDPAELGRIEVAADGHFHEFQTKQKRRQAKQLAEQARDQAVLHGASESEAGEVYDDTYVGIMKQVAQEGLGAVAVSMAEPAGGGHFSSGLNEKQSHKESDAAHDHVTISKATSEEEPRGSSVRDRDHRKSSSSRDDRDRSRRDDGRDKYERSRERKQRRGQAVFSDDEEDRRHSENGDETSPGGNMEKRRIHDEERKDRRTDKERRHRKDENETDMDKKALDESLKDDHTSHSGKEHRSKHSRHGATSRDKGAKRSRKDGRWMTRHYESRQGMEADLKGWSLDVTDYTPVSSKRTTSCTLFSTFPLDSYEVTFFCLP